MPDLIYCINIIERIDLILDTHSTEYTCQTFHKPHCVLFPNDAYYIILAKKL